MEVVTAEGAAEGEAEGAAEGAAEDAAEGEAEGEAEDAAEGAAGTRKVRYIHVAVQAHGTFRLTALLTKILLTKLMRETRLSRSATSSS